MDGGQWPETIAEKMKTNGHAGEDHQGLRLDGAEDEADIAVQQKGGRNADEGDDPADALVDSQRTLTDVG